MTRMMQMFDRLRPAVPLVLRVVLGGLFIYHGYDKFDGGIGAVEQMFDQWGVPAPGLAAPVTAVVEIVAGTALIIGFGTRVAAAVLGILMIGALVYVKTDLGVISTEPMPGAELELTLFGGLVALMAIGPGKVSVDSIAGLDATTASSDGSTLTAT